MLIEVAHRQVRIELAEGIHDEAEEARVVLCVGLILEDSERRTTFLRVSQSANL